MRVVIEKGSRWIVGNGNSLKVWMARWLLRLVSFIAIMGTQEVDAEMRVADLIDKDAGCWREEMVRRTFLPLDAKLVLRIPLYTSWPEDKLI